MSTHTAPQYTWTVHHLAQALINGAQRHGDWGRVAAVQLVVKHETWLPRTDFRRFVVPAKQEGYAWLDLAALAGQIDDSSITRSASSETAILRLACHLVGQVPTEVEPLIANRWTLQTILSALHGTNAALAVEAVWYAAFGPAGAR
jgi:hypothetical protein